ncbi:MAG: RNA polymerase sporulation sigma factor SigK [Eubacterium sp.]|nr:RNA polymerase sporulation sigma factor SigK [Eubacterium sp.]
MQSFPQPLSQKEEYEYLARWEQGDKEARRVLIERNLRLVAYLVRKYSNLDHSVDDLISIGTIGLIKAIDTYRPGKGVRLATYASRCIDNELLMTFRSDKKQSREVFLYEPIGGDDGEGNYLSLLDVLESVDEDIPERMEKEDKISKLYHYIETDLSERERYIIRLRYGIPKNPMLQEQNEVTQREIAKKLGISRSYVSRIEKKALGKLKKAYEGRNS